MGRLLSRVQSLALALGAPGLLLVTFLDSSFLSLPEATDLLLIWMVVQHKTLMPLYHADAGKVLPVCRGNSLLERGCSPMTSPPVAVK